VANDYVELDTLKAFMRKQADDLDDRLLTEAITSASRLIDAECGRRFWLDAAPAPRVHNTINRTFADRHGETLTVDDIGGAPTLVECGEGASFSTLAASSWEAEPLNAIADGRAITGIRYIYGRFSAYRQVRITAAYGWPAIPAEVTEAAKIQASRLYRRKDSPQGVLGNAEWGVVRVSSIDPDVKALIAHLILPGFG
jgi:hypothetical protein